MSVSVNYNQNTLKELQCQYPLQTVSTTLNCADKRMKSNIVVGIKNKDEAPEIVGVEYDERLIADKRIETDKPLKVYCENRYMKTDLKVYLTKGLSKAKLERDVVYLNITDPSGWADCYDIYLYKVNTSDGVSYNIDYSSRTIRRTYSTRIGLNDIFSTAETGTYILGVESVFLKQPLLNSYEVQLDSVIYVGTPGLELVEMHDIIGDYVICRSKGTANRTDIIIPTAYNNFPVTTVNYQAFRESEITSVMMPDTIELIDMEAFHCCKNLTSVVIPSNVTRILDNAFSRSNIETVNFNANSKLQYIGKSAFEYCENLTEINLPKSVSHIDTFAFSYCTNLKRVMLQGGVIEEGAFIRCTNLTDCIIGTNVTVIGSRVFASCFALNTIDFRGSVDQWNAIQKAWNWNLDNYGDSYIKYVACTNGVITL